MLHRSISPISSWTGFVGSDDAFLVFLARKLTGQFSRNYDTEARMFCVFAISRSLPG